MVNTNRIVPVKATDLISLYGIILKLVSDSTTLLKSIDIGIFSLPTSSTSRHLANEPIVRCDVGADVSTSIYFVPAYNFEGFTRAGVPFTISDNGVTVEKDGYTLYRAQLSGSTCTYTKVGL